MNVKTITHDSFDDHRGSYWTLWHEKEIKNLTIYKKGLFNSDFVQENELLSILNPIIKSESMWKPQALYLMAEYYLSKNQKQKSKEFFNQLIEMENISPKIKLEAQKRLRSNFSE